MSTTATSSPQAMLASVDSVINRLGDGSQRKRTHSEISDAPDAVVSSHNDLYRYLHPCLVEKKSNVAVFVMGARGSGKSRMVEDTLLKLDQSKFRILRLNGLVIRGNDVCFAVNELARQMSDLALTQSGKTDSNLLRLKKTSFTSNLALLDETFKLAKVVGKPILIVIDEMDAFMGSTASLEFSTNAQDREWDRQVLMYHILDRVASRDSALSFIGITSHSASAILFEKRVRSRADGTSKTIFVKPFNSYETLTQVLLQKFDGVDGLQAKIARLLCSSEDADDGEEEKQVKQIRQVLKRNYACGKDLRWYLRVVFVALSLYREDVRVSLLQDGSSDQPLLVEFQPKYILESLAIMGASATGCEDASFATNPRTQILKDLSGPQVAVLLAGRRILSRDAREQDMPQPLTFQRMFSDYSTYKGNSNRYSSRLFRRAFTQLLEMDVFRPSFDHSGGGPLQYEYSGSYTEMDATSLSKLPLHVPFQLEIELTRALKDNWLDCSTALRDWGMKENS
jgi:Cdc6-like AAA superfamily ATPase